MTMTAPHLSQEQERQMFESIPYRDVLGALTALPEEQWDEHTKKIAAGGVIEHVADEDARMVHGRITNAAGVIEAAVGPGGRIAATKIEISGQELLVLQMRFGNGILMPAGRGRVAQVSAAQIVYRRSGNELIPLGFDGRQLVDMGPEATRKEFEPPKRDVSPLIVGYTTRTRRTHDSVFTAQDMLIALGCTRESVEHNHLNS